MGTDRRMIPNSTQFPNIIMDNIDKFNDTETKLLIVICRATFGWGKESEWMSRKLLTKRTGKGKTTVTNAISSLVKRGFLVVRSEDGRVISAPEDRRAEGNNHGRLYYSLNILSEVDDFDRPENGTEQ